MSPTLSPHEIATLILLRRAPDQVEMTRAELDTLLASRFVTLDYDAHGPHRPMLTLTAAGERLADTMGPAS